ncbi:MAG: helix-turn-helix domain-containing protein [Gemmataceae bacterium]
MNPFAAPASLAPPRRSPVGDELLTSREVARRLSISVRTLFRLVRAGKFPEPVRYNRRLVRWKSEAVTLYIQQL